LFLFEWGFKLFIESGSMANFKNPTIGILFSFLFDDGSTSKLMSSMGKFYDDNGIPGVKEFTVGMNARTLYND
jgi:hypothetical protein